MKTTNGNGDARPSGNGALPPEYVIAKTLHQRLEKENILRTSDRQDIAYRIAELMVSSKDLYTVTLPRLMGEGDSLGFHDELAGLRMTLLHIRDLVADFDSAFMDAMLHEREGESVDSEWLNPDSWEENELEGIDASEMTEDERD